jgi:hypothetical protein
MVSRVPFLVDLQCSGQSVAHLEAAAWLALSAQLRGDYRDELR